ncbi:IS3 family transposase [Paenibacillus guangzhouensis]|uniref:IS3 family transposase n=1 Tax=Paenibacillus guangzhouensis TaxID=1473112 RepID=UPI003898FE28
MFNIPAPSTILQWKKVLDLRDEDSLYHSRIKAKLKGMSPVQYRTHALKAS